MSCAPIDLAAAKRAREERAALAAAFEFRQFVYVDDDAVIPSVGILDDGSIALMAGPHPLEGLCMSRQDAASLGAALLGAAGVPDEVPLARG